MRISDWSSDVCSSDLASTEQLYAVRVTPGNQVYELKATAQATGRSAGDRPQYRFAIHVNSPPRTLEAIGSVEYRFVHPTFDRKQLVRDDAGNQFRVGYVGWRSEEHQSEIQSLMRIAYDVLCVKTKK